VGTTILAIDTSTELGTVAVLSDDELRSEISLAVRARHGEVLLPHVAQALERAGLAPGDVDLVAVGIGPGSFTGLRVGVATAKGICLATGAPLVGVSSLRVVARGLGAVPWAVPVVDAHKGEVFVAAWPAGDGELGEGLAPFHAPPEEAARRVRADIGDAVAVVCGHGLRRHEAAFLAALGTPVRAAPPVFDAPRGAFVALEGAEVHAREGPSDLAALEPLYLRPSDAKLPDVPLKIGGSGGA
jgi:tRNA threonylcarbamoyladenosine biosynthesis protein TsaB